MVTWVLYNVGPQLISSNKDCLITALWTICQLKFTKLSIYLFSSNVSVYMCNVHIFDGMKLKLNIFNFWYYLNDVAYIKFPKATFRDIQNFICRIHHFKKR